MATVSTRPSARTVDNFVDDPTFETDRQNDCELFSAEEICQFAADDEEAGRRIGKILASLFVYTLVAMSIVTWWTFRVVQP